MPVESQVPRRSNLIDVTYQELHAYFTGTTDGVSAEHVADVLEPRILRLGNITDPFGKPSDASRKKIESGTVTLRDKVVIKVEDADKDFVFAVSDNFNIDEVEALVLLRSFLYNEGLPSRAGEDTNTSLVEELIEAITPFYYSERLFALRLLVPLFRANEESEHRLHVVAETQLPQIIPDGASFAEIVLKEYQGKTQEDPPEKLSSDPRRTSRWAKQNAMEQLVLLEVLFWTMWNYVSCDGPLVVRVFETAYATELGSVQQNGMLLIDAEAAQLQQDAAALWILLMLEVLELERIAEPGGVEISDTPEDVTIYTASPESLSRLHALVMSHQNSQYSCIYLAWAFVLSRLSFVKAALPEVPGAYEDFFAEVSAATDRSYSEPVHILMAKSCLGPEAGLFRLMLTLLTNSPLFVTSVAWRTGSSITDPNAVAFRSVFKGLIIALVELVPVELIPDFDGLVDVWVALFGRSEPQSVSGICRQFWQADWASGRARRALFDVARSRFPVHVRPLVRLLRAMTATGFLDTDPLAAADDGASPPPPEDRSICNQHVFFFLDRLSTYTQAVPTQQTGLYERVTERAGPAGGQVVTYTNLRPMRLPGGSTLPARSTGRLLSGDGGDIVLVAWQHAHSGWKLLLEVLTDYVRRRRGGGGPGSGDVSFTRRGGAEPIVLRLDAVGVEMDQAGDETLVTDILDLLRSVIQDDAATATQLLDALEASDAAGPDAAPDLVQLTTMILEDALSRSAAQPRAPQRAGLITSGMSILSALLALPAYSNRVWLYIRSTAALFGSDRTPGFASAVLAAERLTGHYTMTLALLHLVQQLFREASASVLAVLVDNIRLQSVKEEVLLRAARFVHAEIWVEHVGWKYAQLGDRFEIGRRVATFFAEVLLDAPPTSDAARPFAALSQGVADALLFKATSSTITPLVVSITTAGSLVGTLSASRRYGDARRLIYLLQSQLALTRIILNLKQQNTILTAPSLLEQALCSRGSSGMALFGSTRAKADPIDVLAGYVKERGMGSSVPLEAIRVLHALCASLAMAQPSAPTIVGHLSDPEGTVASLVRIIQHPYDDAALRNAVWNFMSLAVDKEPALAGLFVTGEFRIPDIKGKGKAIEAGTGKGAPSAVETACAMLVQWKELWETNPQLLASVLGFLESVWQHGLEYRVALDASRKLPSFWKHLSGIMREELGPCPDYRMNRLDLVDAINPSNLHEPVAAHAYQTVSKAHVIQIIALDIGMHPQPKTSTEPPTKPESYTALELDSLFKSEEQLTDCVAEAVSNAYDPRLHDEFTALVKTESPALDLQQFQLQDPLSERAFGDNFMFSLPLLRSRVHIVVPDDIAEAETPETERLLVSINLNLSLAHAQTSLTKAWRFLLQKVVPYLRGQASVRRYAFALAATISGDIASEKRSGTMMAAIHNERLSVLLGLLEIAWFSPTDTPEEVRRFIVLVRNVQDIILNEAQPPAQCFLGNITVPFHRTLLQIIYFAARQSRSLMRRPKTINAEQRLTVAALLDSSLVMTISALRITFDAARTRQDRDLDFDMQLLVAVFEQCTRADINTSTLFWLTQCQESDVIRSSLELFVRLDLVGLSDLAQLQSRGQPLYSPHVLAFHMALASIPSSAERLVSEGLFVAYSNNTLVPAISSGMIDVALPELPNERSPAHRAYCTMLAVVTGVVSAMGKDTHFLDAETSGLVQLYGDQIARALGWTIGDPVTLALVEEIEQVAHVFRALSESTRSAGSNTGSAVAQVLRVFATRALLLLQQLNYALTHPHHLASLLEPITADERRALERDAHGAAGGTAAASEIVDPVQRPFLARLVHRLFRLTGSVLATLISISGAEIVLLGDQEDWPVQDPPIVPHSKVVLGEPASLGTLIELGNSTLDVLRHLVGHPAGQALTPAGARGEPALSVRDTVYAARGVLEGATFYAVAQLALVVARPEPVDGHAGEADSEEPKHRLRRGMTGEMAADLLALLVRAKAVVAKTEGIVGKDVVDLSAILADFLQERVIAAS